MTPGLFVCAGAHVRLLCKGVKDVKDAPSKLRLHLHHLGGADWSRGGEFKKPETLARVAPGYSCTNSLSHYLNIRMNTSVVLEELSAHLLLCDCICVCVC